MEQPVSVLTINEETEVTETVIVINVQWDEVRSVNDWRKLVVQAYQNYLKQNNKPEAINLSAYYKDGGWDVEQRNEDGKLEVVAIVIFWEDNN